MKIAASQYNAMYTLQVEEKIYIRQFSQFSDPTAKDEILWYHQEKMEGADFMAVIQDKEVVDDLEKQFVAILE